MDRADKIKSYLLQPFYPQECVGCGKTLPFNKTVCPVCNHFIERFPIEQRCVSCGLTKKNCQCKRTVYRFSGVIAPFYNIGVAQCGFYRYKFSYKYGNALFYEENMLRCIKIEYKDIAFNCIVPVPPSEIRMKKFGFSPPVDISKYLAKKLKLPLFKNALKRKKHKNIQHNLNRQERFAAIRDEYSANRDMSGKTVLLVDDIMTTGATLDECSKILLKAGAEAVYCVTALITDPNAESDKEYTKYLYNLSGTVRHDFRK